MNVPTTNAITALRAMNGSRSVVGYAVSPKFVVIQSPMSDPATPLASQPSTSATRCCSALSRVRMRRTVWDVVHANTVIGVV